MEEEYSISGSTIDLIPNKLNKNEMFLSKQRYIVLAILATSLFCIGESWMNFGYASTSSELINDKFTYGSLFLTTFLVSYSVSALICILINNVIGIKWSILFGCWFNLIGTLIKLYHPIFSKGNLLTNSITEILGNILFGIAMGFLFSLPSLVSEVWFGNNEKLMSLSIPYMAFALGVGVKFIDIHLVKDGNLDAPYKFNSAFSIALWEIWINIMCCLASFGFVLEKPTTSISFCELKQKHNLDRKECFSEIIKTVRIMLCNPHVVALLIEICCIYGAYWIFFILHRRMMENFVKSIWIPCGCVGAIVLALAFITTLLFFLMKNKSGDKYSFQIVFAIHLFCVLPLIGIYFYISNEPGIDFVSFCFLAYFVVASSLVIPLVCQIINEIVQPSNPNISSSLTHLIGILFGSLFMKLIGISYKDLKLQRVISFGAGLFFISLILIVHGYRKNQPRVQQNRL